MARIVIELTNRCNLSCQHCFSGRHGGRDELPLQVVTGILAEALGNGFDDISFTGGEPTLHSQFAEVLRLTYEAGYRFGFVSNGWNFAKTYPVLLPYRDRLGTITFSVDGATRETHDRFRGRGSFDRLLQAMSVCVATGLSFSINTVLSAHNRHEIGQMVDFARGLGSRGLRFCHLMHSPLTTGQGFDLSPDERKDVEVEIDALRRQHSFPIVMAPGYHTSDLFPCSPLQMEEVNVDCHGNLTKCCHLSGHGNGAGQADVIGNLQHTSFTAAFRRLVKENEQFRRTKEERFAAGHFQDPDFFPCWYCSLYYDKVQWLGDISDHSWREHLWSVRKKHFEMTNRATE